MIRIASIGFIERLVLGSIKGARIAMGLAKPLLVACGHATGQEQLS
jgi:hypothetical protein